MTIRGREGRLAATKLKFEQELGEIIEYATSSIAPATSNRLIAAYGSEVYVRVYNHPQKGFCLDIARIQIRQENQHQGIFSYFLHKAEQLCESFGIRYIKVENVLNEKLGDFLQRRGYNAIRDDANVPSYWFEVQRNKT